MSADRVRPQLDVPLIAWLYLRVSGRAIPPDPNPWPRFALLLAWRRQ